MTSKFHVSRFTFCAGLGIVRISVAGNYKRDRHLR